jgi:hypothetical protein
MPAASSHISVIAREGKSAIIDAMMKKLKEVLERAETWPEADQAELAELADKIESRRAGEYHATAEELQALDEADRSGVASDEEVEAAFRTFGSA